MRFAGPLGAEVLAPRLSSVEHLGSNLRGCSSNRYDRAALVQEFSGEKANVPAATHNPPPAQQAAGPGGPQELNVQVRCRREVAGIKPGDQRRSQRVIKHRGQEAALHHSGRIQERLGGGEGDLNRSVVRVDGDEFPPERDRGSWQGCPAFDCIPEWPFTSHSDHRDSYGRTRPNVPR